jgi:hypothetical protein
MLAATARWSWSRVLAAAFRSSALSLASFPLLRPQRRHQHSRREETGVQSMLECPAERRSLPTDW